MRAWRVSVTAFFPAVMRLFSNQTLLILKKPFQLLETLTAEELIDGCKAVLLVSHDRRLFDCTVANAGSSKAARGKIGRYVGVIS